MSWGGRVEGGGDAAGKGKMCIFYEYLCSLFVLSPPLSRGSRRRCIMGRRRILGRYTKRRTIGDGIGAMLRTTQRIFTCFISVLQPGESKINTRCSIYVRTDCLRKARWMRSLFSEKYRESRRSRTISLPRARTPQREDLLSRRIFCVIISRSCNESLMERFNPLVEIVQDNGGEKRKALERFV